MTDLRRRALWTTMILAVAFWSQGAWADPPHSGVCGDCHSQHFASYPAILSELCEGCHFEGGPARAVETHSSLTTDAGYGNWHVDCWECHDAHKQWQDLTWGTSYGMFLYVDKNAQQDPFEDTCVEIKEIDPNDPGPYYPPLSILRTVPAVCGVDLPTNIEHTSPYTFVDGDLEASDDICQVCHLNTNNYNTGAAFNSHSDYGTESQPGGDCMSCHPHEEGFSASGGGCTGCHSNPQGSGDVRRQVTGAGGDFERASHHVTDGSTTEIVADEDCQVCHDQGNHQANIDPGVLLNDPDGGTSFSYDGTGSSIEGFCVNCHDANGSLVFDSDADPGDGSQPFSDGRTPPDIATEWAVTSHNSSTPASLSSEACMACHGGPDGTRSGLSADPNAHGSDQPSILSEVVNGTLVTNAEEELCYVCHDALRAQFAKASAHPLDLATGVHSAGESAVVGSSHVECADCHNPHGADAVIGAPGPSMVPWPAAGPLDGARGVDLAGTGVAPAIYEYEVCFRCHADSPGMPAPPTARQFPEMNTRLEFDGSMLSFHNVAVTGTLNDHVPSLLGSWSNDSLLACTACHNNNSGPGNGGTGQNGPHGSAFPSLLERRYETTFGAYSPARYALCFKCHDSNDVLDNNLSFEEHDKHIDGEDTPCNVCHDPHGSSGSRFLINFDLNEVSPSSNAGGRLEFIAPEDSGDGRGYCYLECHGRDHDPENYNPNY